MKELGYDYPAKLIPDYFGICEEPCYDERIHLWDAQKWLREEKKLHITIYSMSQDSWMFRITKPHQALEEGIYGEDYDSFESALSEGIKEAIKILKEK